MPQWRVPCISVRTKLRMIQPALSRRKLCWRVLMVGVLLSAGCSRKSAERWNPGSPEPGQTCVFLLLGFGDLDGSQGLDQLAATLKDKGCFADLEPYRKWKAIARDVLKNPPARLVLIGHSHGGVDAINIAHVLNEKGVSVQLLVLLDVGRPDPIPANVDVAVHYYVNPPTLSFRDGPRSRLEPGNTHTQLIHVAVGPEGEVPEARDVDHMDICASPAIQKLIADRL